MGHDQNWFLEICISKEYVIGDGLPRWMGQGKGLLGGGCVFGGSVGVVSPMGEEYFISELYSRKQTDLVIFIICCY